MTNEALSSSTTSATSNEANDQVSMTYLIKQFDEVKSLIKDNHQPMWQKITSNPLLITAITLIVTVVFGHLFTQRQQRAAAERSFADELNKQRIQRIGEIWERLDENDYTILRMLSSLREDREKDPQSDNKKTEEIENMIRTTRQLVSKYRFWLGTEFSEKANRYLDANKSYSVKRVSGLHDDLLKEDLKKREDAKLVIEEARERLLKNISN